jgi:PmbA protein
MSGLAIAESALARARTAGAHSCDAVLAEGESLEVRVRGREVDTVSQARERTLGLRVFVERPQGLATAVVSSSDLSDAAIARLAEDSVAIARATAPDPSAGLPSDGFASDAPDLDLFDPRDVEIGVDAFVELARRAEQAAREFDPRIANSEGSSASRELSHVHYASSAGFRGEYRTGSHALFCQPVAAADGAMQTAWWADASRKRSELAAPEDVGRIAARRAVEQLGARSLSTREAPVIFDAPSARDLLGNLVGCLSGYAVYRRGSFLAEKIGERIAPAHVSIVDDGRKRGGLGSKPFDGEGQPTRRTRVIERGVLRSFLLDTYSARKLRLASTGNAARRAGGAPGAAPTNLWLEPGEGDLESLIAATPSGLLVTGMFGHGFNPVTGDFSRGARGFWIERGARAYPVEEITVAGNLGGMLQGIDAIAGDLRFMGSLGAPSLRISRMTIAGA